MNNHNDNPHFDPDTFMQMAEEAQQHPVCEWEPNCWKNADWSGLFHCCNMVWNVCDQHHHQSNQITAMDHQDHARCGRPVYMMIWYPLR